MVQGCVQLELAEKNWSIREKNVTIIRHGSKLSSEMAEFTPCKIFKLIPRVSTLTEREPGFEFSDLLITARK